VLLPTLGKARKQAYVAACASNERQVVQSLILYAQNFKGAIPDNTTGGNPYGCNSVYDYSLGTSRNAVEGWHGLGKLWVTHTMPVGAARAFYCPAPQDEAGIHFKQEQWYPQGGPYTDRIYVSYQYRVFDDEYQSPPYLPAVERPNLPKGIHGQLSHLKMGKMKLIDGGVMSTAGATLLTRNNKTNGAIALVSDGMANRGSGEPLADWAHDNPWGANVGYSDGHVEWIAVPKRIAILPQKWTGNGDPGDSDHYQYQIFKCYDKKDLSDMSLIWP
jgi:prepilin-type processing-associated H-X9-DG protein